MGKPIHKTNLSRPSHPKTRKAKATAQKGAIAGTPLFLQRQPSSQQSTALDPKVKKQAAALKKKITGKLNAIITQATAIDEQVKTAIKNPKKLGSLSFPGKRDGSGKPTVRSLDSIIKNTVANHNKKATIAVTETLQVTPAKPARYHVTEAEVLKALQAANTYSAQQWNEWAGSKTGEWEGGWRLSEIWTQATQTLPVTTYTGIWQDAYWFVDGKTRKDLEKIGFNLTLDKPDGSTLVMGFDPKSNESANQFNPKHPDKPSPKEPMDLNDATKLAKGAHRGYPFTTKQGHLGIVWVSGAEAFVESLIKVNGKRIKVSGGLSGSGRWQYD